MREEIFPPDFEDFPEDVRKDRNRSTGVDRRAPPTLGRGALRLGNNARGRAHGIGSYRGGKHRPSQILGANMTPSISESATDSVTERSVTGLTPRNKSPKERMVARDKRSAKALRKAEAKTVHQMFDDQTGVSDFIFSDTPNDLRKYVLPWK